MFFKHIKNNSSIVANIEKKIRNIANILLFIHTQSYDIFSGNSKTNRTYFKCDGNRCC